VKLAIDIGTTLIKSRTIDGLFEKTIKNPQNKFSPNVLGRVSKALDGCSEELTNSLISAVKELAAESKSKEIAIAANSVMSYSLLNMDLSAFIPHYKNFIEIDTTHFSIEDIYVSVLPCYYPLFGSDALGMIFDERLSPCKDFLSLDFGTNCEIAGRSKNRIITTSIPAGPAFEGEGIEHGMPALNGAISKVIINDRLEISTIGKVKATGICGSGLISIISELKNNKLLDGCIIKQSPWTRNGYFYITPDIYITPKDIEEFLKAWSSVKTGIYYVMRSLDRGKKDLKVCGNFLSNIEFDDLVNLGLPNKWNNVIYSGNSSLWLAEQYLKNKKNTEEAIFKIKDKLSYLELAKFKDFSDIYFKNFKV